MFIGIYLTAIGGGLLLPAVQKEVNKNTLLYFIGAVVGLIGVATFQFTT